jgi:hypothetical protein
LRHVHIAHTLNDALSNEDHDRKNFDVALAIGPTEDREGARILRFRPEKAEMGEIRPLREGKPLGEGEIVSLQPREGTPLLDVKVEHSLRRTPKVETRSGPAQVATHDFRDGWDRIFAAGTSRGSLPS